MSSHEQNETPEGAPWSLLGTLGAMLGLGVALAWASIYVIPRLEGVGLPARLAGNVPFAALAAGAAWGFAMRSSKRAREALSFVVMPVVVGCILWVVGLLLGMLFLLVGAETLADHAPRAGFWLGLAIGVVLAVLMGSERLRGMLSKKGPVA
jgi:hypothetical protein